jgi:hypothetical protein
MILMEIIGQGSLLKTQKSLAEPAKSLSSREWLPWTMVKLSSAQFSQISQGRRIEQRRCIHTLIAAISSKKRRLTNSLEKQLIITLMTSYQKVELMIPNITK